MNIYLGPIKINGGRAGGIEGTTKNPDKGRHQKKNRLFLGKSPKLWVGGGQESRTCENLKIRAF